MYNDKITLTPQDILDKVFKIDARGYRPQEVDKFLDIIIKDYTEYNNIVKGLYKDNRLLEEENNKIKQELRRLKETQREDDDANSRVTNVDLLKRISNLEKTVYGKNL